MAKLPMSAVPVMTPSNIFLAAKSVPPGKVFTLTALLVLFSTSFAHLSIWTHGNVVAGEKLAYVSVIFCWASAGRGSARLIPANKLIPNNITNVFLRNIGTPFDLVVYFIHGPQAPNAHTSVHHFFRVPSRT